MSSTPIDYDPFAEAVREDPHPYYRRLRADAPAYYLEGYDAWALSQFQDIWNASSDTEHYTNTGGAASAQLLTKVQPVDPMINTIDPPEHTLLRTALRRNFLPRNVARLEGEARKLCSRLLEEAKERGGVDIVREFGSRLSVTIACLAIGLPVEDGPLLTKLVQGFFSHDPDTGGMTAEGMQYLGELNTYCADKIAERRRNPNDSGDPLDTIATMHYEGAPYASAAAATHISMLVVGGSETFPKVLASTMVRMAEYRDQRNEIIADPSLIPDAFDEALRFDMPTQYLGRTVKKDHTLHGQTIRAGQTIIFLYPSANRDENEFANPDTFDIHRKPPRLLSFGAGVHQCLGRHIARMEGKVSLETLLPALGDYEIDFDNAVRLRTEFVQGYGSLPIHFTPL